MNLVLVLLLLHLQNFQSLLVLLVPICKFQDLSQVDIQGWLPLVLVLLLHILVVPPLRPRLQQTSIQD
jgi:hypothetical protein